MQFGVIQEYGQSNIHSDNSKTPVIVSMSWFQDMMAILTGYVETNGMKSKKKKIYIHMGVFSYTSVFAT
jgi:hypothetical protein